MTHRPPGTLRVLQILASTSLRRLLRAAHIRRAQRAKRPGRRGATGRKRGDALMVVMLLMLPIFGFNALIVSGQAVVQMSTAAQSRTSGDTLLVSSSVVIRLRQAGRSATDEELLDHLARSGVDDDDRPSPRQIVEHFRRHGAEGFRDKPRRSFLLLAPHAGLDPPAARLLASSATLILLALGGLLLVLAFGAADANLAGGAWTQAWLMTFPVATRSLILARALEYSLVQLFPWFTLFPLLLQVLRAMGQPGALWLAVAATLSTTALTGSLRLWLETWLRLRFSLRALRSIQAACTLLALLLLTTVFAICLGDRVPDWFLDAAQRAPIWLQCLPAAWPVAHASGGLLPALPGVLVTLVVFALTCQGTSRLLAHGAMRSGGVDPGARHGAKWETSARRLGIVGKDLAMLRRDRNFLVQTLVVPLFVIALQLIVNPGLGRVQGKGVAMLAYGIGLYSLIGGCFQVLSAEGRALWILYTLPVPIADVLRRKARIWAGTAVAIALGALLVFSLRAGGVEPRRLAADALLVGVGVWCAAHVAAGISILGTDPAADHVPRQPKPRHVYLYFFFAGTYFMGLQSTEPAVRFAGLLVFATLAFAVWQRACDRVPWLLDPVDEHRPSIGLYDGAIALVVFFALQGLVLVVSAAVAGRGASPPTLMFVAFTVAGAITVLVAMLLLAGRGVSLREVLGWRLSGVARPAGSLLAGALAGAAAGSLGVAYVRVMHATGWIELPPMPASYDRTALALLAVVAAPLVEEVLFRGLVFQGLARGVKAPLAVLWSSALFAAMHPAASWPPVFVMGVAAALVFHRTRWLPAAIAVHAVYNAIVVVLLPPAAASPG